PSRWPSPTLPRMRRAGSSTSRSPRSSSGSITFSSAVSDGSSWKFWNTKPTFSPRTRARPSSSSEESSRPSSSTRPLLGTSSPAISDNSVLLPEPDVPTIATVSPRPMAKCTSSRMVSGPPGSCTCLPRESTSSIGAAAAGVDREEAAGSVIIARLVWRKVMQQRSRTGGARAANRVAGPALAAQCAIGLMLALLLAWPRLAAAQDRTPGDGAPTVLVMGDSLSAAYGMAAADGWVALMAERLAARQPRWDVVNASISGETTAGGRSRIVDALARHRPEVVVIALGANDGLRGLPTQQTAANLAYMIGAAHGAGARVLLVGMQMPPNL